MPSIYDTHKPESGGGGLYLKIEDGQTVKLRIASEPAIYQSESQDGKMSTRYAWIVWNQDEQVAQILQQSATFFRQVAGLAQDDEWGDPQGYDLKIKREGTGLDTRYSVNPSPNKEPLSSDAKSAVRDIDLLAKLESPFASSIFWLSDFDNPSKTKSIEGTKSAPKQATAKEEKKDVVIEDIGDEPINLDDIPF